MFNLSSKKIFTFSSKFRGNDDNIGSINWNWDRSTYDGTLGKSPTKSHTINFFTNNLVYMDTEFATVAFDNTTRMSFMRSTNNQNFVIFANRQRLDFVLFAQFLAQSSRHNLTTNTGWGGKVGLSALATA